MNISIPVSKSLSVICNIILKRDSIFLSKKLISPEKYLHSVCRITEHPIYEKILQPTLPIVTQQHGMKVAGKVQRRCESCKLMWRKGRIYNLCKEFPRHNQMSNIPNEKSTWILTWASQSPRRPW